MNYAKQILELRKKLSLTQNELALILGVVVISISRWERGHFEPTLKVKKQLRRMFRKVDIIIDD